MNHLCDPEVFCRLCELEGKPTPVPPAPTWAPAAESPDTPAACRFRPDDPIPNADAVALGLNPRVDYFQCGAGLGVVSSCRTCKSKVPLCGPDCPSYAAEAPEPVAGEIVLNMGAGGLGDGVQGVAAAAAVKRDNPGAHVVYRVGPSVVPWVEHFEGPDEVRPHDFDFGGLQKVKSSDRQMNLNYPGEMKAHGSTPRLMRYTANVGAEAPGEYRLKDPVGLRHSMARFSNYVALCPWSNGSDRELATPVWRELERQLQDSGYRTVLIHSNADRVEGFKSELLIGRTPAEVLGALLNCVCAIGCDSGLSHVAAATGTPTIVVMGQTSGPSIFGLYPRAVTLAGLLSCSPCYWQGPYDQRICGRDCPSIQTISIDRIRAEVDRVALGLIVRDRTLVDLPRLAVLRDVVRLTNNLRGHVAELGVYRGGTAKLISHFTAGTRLHLFDNWGHGIPEDDADPMGDHKAGDFAADLGEVRDFIENPRAVFYPGTFPETAGEAWNVRFRMVHVDADTYQSTAAALEFFAPRMVPGGAMVFDDFNWHATPGVARALYEWFDPQRVQTLTPFQAVVWF